MSTFSPEATPVSSHVVSSPPLKGIKKVLTGKRRSSEVQSETSSLKGGHKGSVPSLTLEKSPSRKSGQSSPGRDDGSSKSGSSGVRKLIPGHSKRRRRRVRDEELRAAAEDMERGRSPVLSPESATDVNRSTPSFQDGDSGLLTDDSEPDTAPPLTTRDSHAGYLTTSSPLITTTTAEEDASVQQGDSAGNPTNSVPILSVPDADVSPTALPVSDSTTSLPTPGLVDRADSLRPEGDNRGRPGSISRLRGKSPARRFKDVFTPNKAKSPKTSPERKNTSDSFGGGVSNLLGKGNLSDRRLSKYADRTSPTRVETAPNVEQFDRSAASIPPIMTDQRPSTPTSAEIQTPVTTVTPPTPTIPQAPDSPRSPRRFTEAPIPSEPSVVVSPSGNMISHRRTRSQSSTTNQPSKLSSSIFPPLTPTIEEGKSVVDKEKIANARNVTPGGSFFSSWVSAAQNAASTITNQLNTQNRSRSSTNKSEGSEGGKPSQETVRGLPLEPAEPESPKKQLAIETLGSGDLDFSHLGIESVSNGQSVSPLRPDLEELRKNSTVQRDEAAAKIEDMLAKRAVSAAYEAKVDQTPIAEIPDPLQGVKHTATGTSTLLGEQTPPNGSIFGDDTGSIKRSTSMRSRLARRRSRGSSAATGASTIGAIIGASTATLAHPAAGPRLSGFAIAPKQRNRAFHQQFRSVPEDDYLIEDYSCALQKEILLAGRLYISEGHICFSSNILGWVTTLVISFEEVVSIERETTAMVFPNAIAIQTLHARHTFRSLLSREATFDLMIAIWKVSHPASFKKSINGKQWMEAEAAKQQQTVESSLAANDAKSEDGSEDSGVEGSSDDDEDDGSGASFAGSAPSMAGSEFVDSKSLNRKPSAMNGSLAPPAVVAVPALPAEGSSGLAAAVAEQQADFPGPVTHAPTDCTDSGTHYEKIIKDEVLPAPLGKIYSLLFGPASGSFVRKYLLEEQKALDLNMEEGKKGLNNDNKTRQYSYIKPLGGSIGPKQTKCITIETLDFFDLEQAVSVTCSTATPDVPSGNAFSTKTRYCLSWAPGNQTRLQINCGLEWTAKSWLKGPIEKGAGDGQQSYGDGLVRVLKAAVETRKLRERGGTGLSKNSAGKRGKKKRSKKTDEMGLPKALETKKEESWGIFEPARPFVGILGPLGSPWALLGFLLLLMFVSWLRSPRVSTSSLGFLGSSQSPQRLAAYEEMWRREESELWDWLEDRVGTETLRSGRITKDSTPNQKAEVKKRKKILSGKNVEARLREEKMSEREMEEQIRVTKERLGVLQRVMEKRKEKRP